MSLGARKGVVLLLRARLVAQKKPLLVQLLLSAVWMSSTQCSNEHIACLYVRACCCCQQVFLRFSSAFLCSVYAMYVRPGLAIFDAYWCWHSGSCGDTMTVPMLSCDATTGVS